MPWITTGYFQRLTELGTNSMLCFCRGFLRMFLKNMRFLEYFLTKKYFLTQKVSVNAVNIRIIILSSALYLQVRIHTSTLDPTFWGPTIDHFRVLFHFYQPHTYLVEGKVMFSVMFALKGGGVHCSMMRQGRQGGVMFPLGGGDPYLMMHQGRQGVVPHPFFQRDQVRRRHSGRTRQEGAPTPTHHPHKDLIWIRHSHPPHPSWVGIPSWQEE